MCKAIWLALVLVLSTIVVSLSVGCSRTEKSPVVVELDDADARLDEVMVYLLQTVNEFERLGGEDVWDVEDFSGGKTAGEVAKERAIENIIKVKIIASKKSELGIELDDAMMEEINKKASDYYSNLRPDFAERYGIDVETVKQVFIDNKTSSLVMEKMTANTEISEEDIMDILDKNPEYINYKTKSPESLLTKLTIKQVTTKTHEVSSNGQLVPLDEEAVAAAFEKISEAKRLLDEGVPMDEVIKAYSEDDRLEETNGIYTISQGLLTPIQAEAIEPLEIGEYTDVVAGERGYYIIQLIDKVVPTATEVEDYKTQFQQWEEELRKKAVEQLRSEAFDAFYAQWRSEASIQVNQDVWGEIGYEDVK